MPKYRTVDQHIKWQGKYIPPDTEVTVEPGDIHIWDALVRNKVAIRLQDNADVVPEDDQNPTPVASDEP